MCYPDRLVVRHLNDEDLSVIMIERGMVDDHLPNNVLNALKGCQKEQVGNFRDAEEIRSMKEQKIARIAEEKGIQIVT